MAKEWNWSYSKLKNYRNCPKKHYEVDLQKNYTENSEALTQGNQVHDALANACTGAAPLPVTMAYLQKWVDLVRNSTGELKVEEKYAITRDFQPTQYFAPNVWYRGICDVLKLDYAKEEATALDWKTGKVGHDSTQLMLMASCIIVHYPQIQKVKTRFIWLGEDCTTRDVWDRNSIMQHWNELLPEIKTLESASKTLEYPPKRSGLCKRYCPVTTCAFHGKGLRD